MVFPAGSQGKERLKDSAVNTRPSSRPLKIRASCYPQQWQPCVPPAPSGVLTHSRGLSVGPSSLYLGPQLVGMYGSVKSQSSWVISQILKRVLILQETWVLFLHWEDLLERDMATHSSILAEKSYGQRSLRELPSMGSQEWDTT